MMPVLAHNILESRGFCASARNWRTGHSVFRPTERCNEMVEESRHVYCARTGIGYDAAAAIARIERYSQNI